MNGISLAKYRNTTDVRDIIMSQLLSNLRTKTKFIYKLIENGYVFTNLPTLLHSIGIHEFHDDIEILLTTKNVHIFIDTLHRIGIDNALSICDELRAIHALALIVQNIQKLDNVSNIQIINATMITSYNKLIITCDNGYRIIGSDTHANTYHKYHIDNYDVQQINNACANGLYMQDIVILTEHDTYNFTNNIYNEASRITVHEINFRAPIVKMLQSFENINTLSATINLRGIHIYHKYDDAYTFTKKIKTLTTNWMNGDIWLNSFQNLRNLDVSHNQHITTCNFFAESLKIVKADGMECTLSDDGLKFCTKIRSLSACDNNRITTCEPFPNIKIVVADVNSGICDRGLLRCKKIRSLSVSFNEKVTTCAPFARTLKVLYASDNNSMGDSGIALCTNLIHLNADNNSRISSCAPFKHTLRTLSAKGASPLSDDALKICTNLKTVFCRYNPKITDSSKYQLIK